MEHKTKLVDYLPEFMKGYQEIQTVIEIDQIEIDKMWLKCTQAIDNNYVNTSDEYGAGRWENVAGITPKSNSTLKERRATIIAKMNEQLPFTYRRLLEMVTPICGDSGFKLTLNPAEFSLNIKVRASARTGNKDAVGLLAAVDSLVKRVKPCNLTYGSSLFERHDAAEKTFYGCGISVNKKYNVEVSG